MMVICTKQHLSNIWSSNTETELKKVLHIKKNVHQTLFMIWQNKFSLFKNRVIEDNYQDKRTKKSQNYSLHSYSS